MVKYFLEEARERICSPPARSILSPPPDPSLQGPPRAASRGRPGPGLLEPSLPPVSSTSPPKPPVLESKLPDSREPVALTRLPGSAKSFADIQVQLLNGSVCCQHPSHGGAFFRPPLPYTSAWTHSGVSPAWKPPCPWKAGRQTTHLPPRAPDSTLNPCPPSGAWISHVSQHHLPELPARTCEQS